MIREECSVGMRVMFGRGQGEQTIGIVERMGPKKAKIKTVEARGRSGRSPAGTIWSVPYSLMHRVVGEFTVPAVEPAPVAPAPAPAPAPATLSFDPWGDKAEEYILLAICQTYASLSPETLTCDGELPRHLVAARGAAYRRRLDSLFAALGRKVSEVEADRWFADREEHLAAT